MSALCKRPEFGKLLMLTNENKPFDIFIIGNEFFLCNPFMEIRLSYQTTACPRYRLAIQIKPFTGLGNFTTKWKMCHCHCKFAEKTPLKASPTVAQSMHTRKKNQLCIQRSGANYSIQSIIGRDKHGKETQSTWHYTP